jgi:CRISPR-associated protein Csh2
MEKNSEILYLYDAKLCNPNGDPDEENKPRMDYSTNRCLVSDVRFKRYMRDYWLSLDETEWKRYGYERKQDVWVRTLEENGEEKVVSAKQRIDGLAKVFGSGSAREAAKKPEFKQWLLKNLIDVRFFGATIPVGEEGSTGASITWTGPVQFAWGYSMNRAEILPSSTITSHFAGREQKEKGGYGTMGKDWRIKYALLAFYGTVSAWRARFTNLTEGDLNFMDHTLIEALPLIATTRSKIGQTPRLYLRVEYKDDRTFLGDLRGSIVLKDKEGLEDVKAVKLDCSALLERFNGQSAKIKRILFWAHPDIDVTELRDGLMGLETKGIDVVEIH